MNINKNILNKASIINFLLLNVGIVLLAFGIYFFKFPNNFSTGGVSGLSVILAATPIPLSSATLMFIFNILFLILGFIFLGKDLGFTTAYCSIAFSVLIQLLEVIYPMQAPFTNSKMLELAFAIILPGVGSAILFTLGTCSGGTDILALIINKNTSINLGLSLLISDFLITFATLFFFGIETCLYSMLGLILKSFVLDSVIENISTKKIAIVITAEKDAIIDYITNNIHRGVTLWNCAGGFTGTQKTAILTALTRTQARDLKQFVKAIDKTAFIIVNNSTEIIGKGFYRNH